MKSYPSKILLLGEYTVIHNSSALAIPFTKYESHWSDHRSEDPTFENNIDEEFSVSALKDILLDLKKLKRPKLNLVKFKNYLDEGLWICSNSPLGYGLGSSGAVSAAIYDRFCLKKSSSIQDIKLDLARIENAFHGKSSGIDPLVSYTQKPIWIKQNGDIEFVDLPEKLEGINFFLIDTKKNRNSTPLINYYLKSAAKSDFKSRFIEPMKVNVENAIKNLLSNETEFLFNDFSSISVLEFMHLPPMVTEQFRDIWHHGIESNDYYLKICGAGGGGYILGITKDIEKTKSILEEYTIELIY